MKQKILMTAIGVFGLAMSSPAALVAHYQFDEVEGTTAFNSVTGGSDGVISGGVTVGQTGISGGAYLFNGTTGFVDMANANFFSAITTSGQLSFSVWINTSNPAGGANRSVVVSAANAGAANSYIDLGTINSNPPEGVVVYDAFARNRTTGNGINTYGGSSVANGGWQHLVMTIDLAATSNHLRLYVGGVEVGAETLTGGNIAFPTFNNFEVGRLGRQSPTDYFSGLIDDVRVYDHALSASEVNSLYTDFIPEPSSVGLAGLGALSLLRRKRG